MLTPQEKRQEVMDLVVELLDIAKDYMVDRAKRILLSGAIDIETQHSAGRYWLPKLLATDALRHAADQFYNHHDQDWQANLKNLESF